MTLRILGVYRETEFSPGKVGDDAGILDTVLDHFKADQAGSRRSTPTASSKPRPHATISCLRCARANER